MYRANNHMFSNITSLEHLFFILTCIYLAAYMLRGKGKRINSRFSNVIAS